MKQPDTDTTAKGAEDVRDPNTFTLDAPIQRGDQTIDKVKLRKPNVEALRGLQLATLAQMDVDQLTRLLPRISSPTLTEHDVAQMEASDLLKAGGIVLGFLFPKAAGDLQSLSA